MTTPKIDKVKMAELEDWIAAEKQRKAKSASMEKPKNAELPDTAMLRLEKIFQESLTKRKSLEAWAATQPATLRCEAHSFNRPIDFEESCRQTKQAGKNTLAYSPCLKCVSVSNGFDSWLLRAGVPMDLVESDFENWIPDTNEAAQVVTDLQMFCKKRTGFFVLLGDVGVGKSHLAVAAMKEFHCGIFVTQVELLEKLRATYKSDRAVDIVTKCKQTRLLVLDELGFSAGGRDELPMLHSILSHRHGNYLPTIITGNLIIDQKRKINELEEAIGPRLIDRMRQSAFKVVTIEGKSKRRDFREKYQAHK